MSSARDEEKFPLKAVLTDAQKKQMLHYGNTELLFRIAQFHPRTPDEITALNLKEINTPDSSPLNGNTPLLLAIKLGLFDLAHYLLRQGAMTNLHDARGFFPIHYAAMLRDETLIKAIIQHSEIGHGEVIRNNRRTAFYLLEKPKSHTLDWKTINDDGIQPFESDITAQQLLRKKLSTKNLMVKSNHTIDSRKFCLSSFPHSNLHWFLADIASNLNLINSINNEEMDEICKSLSIHKDADFHYLSNERRLKLSAEIFVTAINKKPVAKFEQISNAEFNRILDRYQSTSLLSCFSTFRSTAMTELNKLSNNLVITKQEIEAALLKDSAHRLNLFKLPAQAKNGTSTDDVIASLRLAFR